MTEYNPPIPSRETSELILIANSTTGEWQQTAIDQAREELQKRNISPEQQLELLAKIEEEEKWSKDSKLLEPYETEETLPSEEDIRYKAYLPWVTIGCIIACIVLAVGFAFAGDDSWNTYKKWGAPSVYDMWNGAWWGVITNNFLNTNLLFLVFGIYWLWVLGKRTEFMLTSFPYLLFIASSAWIAEIAQISLSGTSGIGTGGIDYALFGFLYIRSRLNPVYKHTIDKNTTYFFMGSLLLFTAISFFDFWYFAIIASIGALLWGALIAVLIEKSPKIFRIIIPATIIALSAVTLKWAPWCKEWLLNEAFNHHNKWEYDEAEVLYKKVLTKNPQDTVALLNLKIISADRAGLMADSVRTREGYNKAAECYEEVLDLDPENEWAKTELARVAPYR